MRNSNPIRRLQELAYEYRVATVMERDVVTVSPSTLMSEFGHVLREQRISGTPVIDRDEMVGIVSIDDLMSWLLAGAPDGPVQEQMTRDMITVYADEPVAHAVGKLDHYGYGRLPVLDRETHRLVGIVTPGLLVEELAKALETSTEERELSELPRTHFFSEIKADRTTLIFEYHVTGKDVNRGGEVASGIKKTLKSLRVHPDVCRRAAIAVYEAEMNIIIHADSGDVKVVIHPDELDIHITDTGPGIPDVKKALERGYSTAPGWARALGFGAGIGLHNIKECADRMRIASREGKGTALHVHIKMERPCNSVRS